MTKFIIQNSQLVLESKGEIISPTADEIYRSVIEGEQVWSDLAPGKSDIPEGVVFSRYSVNAKMVLERDIENSNPSIRITYFHNSNELKLFQPLISDVDHLIYEGVWYPIDVTSVAEVDRLLTETGVKVGIIKSLKIFLKLKQVASGNYYFEDRTASEIFTPFTFIPDKKGAPNGICAELYPYQLDGWNWLRFIVSENVGGLLADEMGLGKTLQIISVLTDSGGEPLFPALIVAPGSLLENWTREIKRFSPKLSILKHHGPSRTGDPKQLKKSDIVITTYESIVRDNSLMLMVDWGIVVIDEAQNIKNPNAKRTHALKRLNRKVAIAVTGTPVENRLTDIWSILDFIIPGYLGSQPDFERRFCNDFDGGVLLEPFISPIILRRTISLVASDLPERIDIPQAIKLEPDEARYYETIRADIFQQYEAGASLVALSSLRMFCSHPMLYDNEERWLSDLDSNVVSFSKFQRFDEIIQEIIECKDKVIVFTSFTKMSDLIANHIKKKYKIFVGCLDGRLPIDERQTLIDDFSNISGSAVLVLNPRAGGAGLNITAANHVIHYNLEWNPALEDQASARAYRKGQIKPVTVHRLFIADSVEEVINERLQRKRGVSEAAVVGITGKDEDYNDIVAALQRSPL